MVALLEKIERAEKRKPKWISNILSDHGNIESMSLNFRFLEYNKAVYQLSTHNVRASKQHFYGASLLDKLRIEKYNNTMLDYDLSAVTYPILSDNQQLIDDYSKIRYQAWGEMPVMDENILKGKSAIWCNTVQHFMAKDLEKVQRNLNILETMTLPKLPKNQKELLIDYEFYKALLSKDKDRCEELLEQLVSPKAHKKRNENVVLNKYVSQPALGYAKLAWKYGLEVNINNPLVPQEILPIEPLDHYEIPYEFLKDEIS